MLIRVLGKDMKVGDMWQGDRVLAVSRGSRRCPASVLVDCVAREHPEGLDARTITITSNTRSGSIGCTIFDDTYYQVER